MKTEMFRPCQACDLFWEGQWTLTMSLNEEWHSHTPVSVCSTVTLTVLWLLRIKTEGSKSVRSPTVPAPNDGVEQRWSSRKAKNANSHHNLKDMAQSNSICWLSAWDKRKPDVYSARALCNMLSCVVCCWEQGLQRSEILKMWVGELLDQMCRHTWELYLRAKY